MFMWYAQLDVSWIFHVFIYVWLFTLMFVVLWLAWMYDECTWHHKTFLMQLYWHLVIKLYILFLRVLYMYVYLLHAFLILFCCWGGCVVLVMHTHIHTTREQTLNKCTHTTCTRSHTHTPLAHAHTHTPLSRAHTHHLHALTHNHCYQAEHGSLRSLLKSETRLTARILKQDPNT